MDVDVRAQKIDGLMQAIVSRQQDSSDAFQEISSQIVKESTAFVLLFLPDRELTKLDETNLAKHLGHLTVFGCSTAGQLTPEGYENSAYMALVFPKSHFRVSSLLLPNIVPFALESSMAEIEKNARQFQRSAHWNRFALLITDGLSKQEDLIIASITALLPSIPVFGGSAADGQRFGITTILANGQFHNAAALLLLVETDLDFELVCFDHFVPTEQKMIITKALPDERLVLEINGAPAAEEYAQYVGVKADQLSPQIFAQNPLLVQNSSSFHVRSIQQMTNEGGLAFLCAIDEGLILTLGKGEEIVRTMERELSLIDSFGRSPNFILAFDCFLRRLEIDDRGRTERASKILRQHNVFGFNTYGEQHTGLHVNQTFVGVAFYHREGKISL